MCRWRHTSLSGLCRTNYRVGKRTGPNKNKKLTSGVKNKKCVQGNIQQDEDQVMSPGPAGPATVTPFVTPAKASAQSVLLVCS